MEEEYVMIETFRDAQPDDGDSATVSSLSLASPKVVRMLASLLKELFTHPFEQYPPFLPKSPWWGCSDASASRTGEAYVGGWRPASPNPTKDTVLWFHYAITADAHPWAFKDGNPQKRIAALELLGTLLLCKHLVAQQGQLPGRVRLPVGSDNSGNIFSLLNLSAKKPYALLGRSADGIGSFPSL